MIHSARTLAVLALCFAATAHAQRADTVLLNGKIVTADERGAIHQAVAVRDGRIVALGKSAVVRRLAGKNTRVVDLHGRTVIPGMIDVHMHAIRAGLSYATEVNWLQALRMYTAGSAWFAHDDARRGALGVGKLADLVVLNKDYLTVPLDEIGGLHSLLTMVGGRVVYAEGDYKTYE